MHLIAENAADRREQEADLENPSTTAWPGRPIFEALAAAMYAGRLGEPGALVSVAEAALAAVGRVPTPPSAHRSPPERYGESDRRRHQRWLRPDSHRVAAHVHASPAGRWPSAALDVAGGAIGVRHRRTLGRCDLPSTHLRGQFGTRGTPVHWPYFHRHSPTARGPPAGRRIRHGGNSLSKRRPRSRLRRYAQLRYHALNLAAWRGLRPTRSRLIEAAAADATAGVKAVCSG